MIPAGARGLTTFRFEGGALVRVVMKDEAPWFVAADVCRILCLSKHRDAIARLDHDERGAVEVDTLGGRQELAAVSEGGLFTLILRCRDAVTPGTVAHRFRKWVTGEVLPALRRDGHYETAGRPNLPGPVPEPVLDLALKLRTVTEARQSWGTATSQQMWLKLGLPTVRAMLDPQRQPDLFERELAEGML